MVVDVVGRGSSRDGGSGVVVSWCGILKDLYIEALLRECGSTEGIRARAIAPMFVRCGRRGDEWKGLTCWEEEMPNVLGMFRVGDKWGRIYCGICVMWMWF